ncbi:MAG: NRDE family protein [Halolamina sp.]
MCTLTLAWRAFPTAPVVVAANRDESVDRPAASPSRRPLWAARPDEPAPLSGADDDPLNPSVDETPGRRAVGGAEGATDENGSPQPRPRTAIAPRDERVGGTWIGANDRGVFAGVTNRWVGDLDGDRSRGLLVADCLRAPTAEAAARHVERAVEADAYAGFNLVVADAAAALLLEWDGSLRVTRFDPGVHVVVNVGADGAFVQPPNRPPEVGPEQADDARRVRATLAPEPGEAVEGWLSRAKATLGDHGYGVCVHGDGFGTRSSSALILGDRRRYEFADGPPCEAPFEPVAEGWPAADDDRV